MQDLEIVPRGAKWPEIVQWRRKPKGTGNQREGDMTQEEPGASQGS